MTQLTKTFINQKVVNKITTMTQILARLKQILTKKKSSTPKCAYPDYSDDDEEFNDKESETSTPASNRNVNVNTRKRKRQSSVFSITKNRLREDFEDVLSSFECPLSSNEIIEIGKDLFLALREKYLEICNVIAGFI